MSKKSLQRRIYLLNHFLQSSCGCMYVLYKFLFQILFVYLNFKVKGSTKLTNVIEFAKDALDKGEHRDVVWTASGGGVIKAISCAEILKRSYPVHQVTRICYRKYVIFNIKFLQSILNFRVNEYWQPQIDGLEEIVASRQIPCIHIWQSLDVISTDTLGYQNGSSKTDFYVEKPPRKEHRPKSGQPKGPGMRNNNKKFKQTNK